LPKIVDLREIFGGMRKMLTRLLPGNVELQMFIPDRLSLIRIDPGHAEQILLNLVVNAGDAMPEGGQVSVMLHDEPSGGGGIEGHCVQLVVSDTGIGMDDKTREHIFEPFFTTKSDGTGLGLAMVHDLVAISSGSVVVDSAPDRGAVFHVFWPVSMAPAQNVISQSEISPAMTTVRGGCVLLVDDDDAVRRFSARSLERAGFEVLTAADGAEALRLSETHEGQFDLLVLDVVLPRLRGIELAADLRVRQPTAQLLFISGNHTDFGILPQGKDGQTHFLPKPFTSAMLAEQARELLSA
jgi:CheY-like chemotaxis protein/anti-sigma regulatory factor (Ser/Thr protein kinase)